MSTIALIVNCVAALGMIAGAEKYAFGPAPAAYHRAILGNALSSDDGRVQIVFRAIYRAIASGLLAAALAVLLLAFLAHDMGTFGAKLATVAVGATVMPPAFLVTRGVARETGRGTPWKSAAAVLGLLVLGFLVSLL